MIKKIYKSFGEDIIYDTMSETCWDLLTYSADGSKNGWYEVEKTEAPAPPKEVQISINTRKEDKIKVDNDKIIPTDILEKPIEVNVKESELDKIEAMKRQELFAYLKENGIKFSPKDKNDKLKQIIKDAISKK